MTIAGRITVDAAFQYSPNTNAMIIVSLEDTTAASTGVVARVTGTCGTTQVTITPSSIDNQSYTGNTITFASVSRVVVNATAACELRDSGGAWIVFAGGTCSASVTSPSSAGSIKIKTLAGTATYDIILFGT